MTLSSREGQRVPDVDLCRLSEGSVHRVSAADFFGGRRVLVFALPGAFTPKCSTAHVPGYVARANDFKKAGIDDIVCLSVNDPFVMDAWQDAEKARAALISSLNTSRRGNTSAAAEQQPAPSGTRGVDVPAPRCGTLPPATAFLLHSTEGGV